TQEIKEAIKEIVQEVKPNEENYKEIKEQNEGNIKNVQEVFELNPWLLEKLTDEQLKTEFIKLLYNREHLTGRLLTELREKHLLSEENKILDKGVRYKNKEITRICVSKCYPFDSIRHLDKIEINLEEVKNVLFEEVGKDEKKDKKFHYGTNHVRKYSPLLNEIKELCKESGQKELLIKQLQEENKKLIGQINKECNYKLYLSQTVCFASGLMGNEILVNKSNFPSSKLQLAGRKIKIDNDLLCYLSSPDDVLFAGVRLIELSAEQKLDRQSELRSQEHQTARREIELLIRQKREIPKEAFVIAREHSFPKEKVYQI
ncbi:6264_t:CDS:2, partial [Racocetra persica]